tara:strand:+ start:523 stop:915 length:393 start_codon:yes stop_codon:yes gene_type:complete
MRINIHTQNTKNYISLDYKSHKLELLKSLLRDSDISIDYTQLKKNEIYSQLKKLKINILNSFNTINADGFYTKNQEGYKYEISGISFYAMGKENKEHRKLIFLSSLDSLIDVAIDNDNPLIIELVNPKRL